MKNARLITQLNKIEKLAELKAEQLEAANFQKYHHLFEMAIDFLKTQNVLLYGGYAINELMPANDKIYKKNSLPDIDVFSVFPSQVAKGLVKMFKDKGIELTNFSEALHEGTYKVFVQGIQIVDITGMSKRAFDKLRKRSVEGDSGMRVVDPQFLRLSLHMMLSQTNSSDRWPKVFARLNTFYRHFPPKECKGAAGTSTTSSQLPEEMVAAIYKHLKQTPYVLFGSKEMQEMVSDAEYSMPSNLPWIQIIADQDVMHVAQEIVHAVPGFTFHTSKMYPGDDFVGPHVFLMFKKTKVVAIHNVKSCITFHTFRGLRVATIHTMLRMYLTMLMSPYKHFEKTHDSMECMVNALSILQQKSVGSKKHLLQQMVIDCYGTEQGVITLKRERLLRIMQK